VSKNGWASHPLEFDAATAFASLEASVTVRLIATFEPDLIYCEEDDLVSQIRESDRYRAFDYLPVKSDGRVVGLLSLSNLRNNSYACSGPVSKQMKQIDDTILISRDVSILAFIEHAEEHPCRLVVSGVKLDGIVTLSDLQKLPVRPLIFFLITHLELLMAAIMRSTFNDDGDWLRLLSPSRCENIESDWNELRKENMDIDRILATQFCDKRDAILKSGFLLPGISRKKADKQLKDIEKSRNNIAHAGDIASGQSRALQTIHSVKSARQWIKYFADELTARGHSP
jgi:CBS domain-containing protein